MKKKNIAESGKILIEMTKSANSSTQKQRDNLRALGLRKIGSKSVRPNNNSVKGSIKIVSHLVTVEEL